MTYEPSSEEKAVLSVLQRLDLPQQDDDRFVAEPAPVGGPRQYCGLVAGQAMVAAARTVDGGLQPHSLHAYFLQPGDPQTPVVYEVQRLKEGKNFHARQVTGTQDGRVIFSLQASFLRPEAGFEHQDPMPDAPPPESIDGEHFGFWGRASPMRLRECPAATDPATGQATMRRLWIQPVAALPEDPVLHLGLIVFASDMSLVGTGMLPHPELRHLRRGAASLDHAMWFHRPIRFDGWVLYTMETPAAHGSRALIHGAMYDRDGTRLVSVAQEGLLRLRSAGPSP
jgi:acyl-CoA thioesterase-2